MGLSLFSKKKPAPVVDQTTTRGPNFEPAERIRYAENALERMLQQRRYGQIVVHGQHYLEQPGFDRVLQAAIKAIDERFAMVPEGFVSIPTTISDDPGSPEQDVETAPYLLARYSVTNADFQAFVDSGGYEDLALWPEDIWPHLIDLKDLTGQPAPRFWYNTRHDRRFADHPVVGICFYEAQAYCTWAGVRLPTEAEWQMAASWRIRSAANVNRRYPWGDTFDLANCNIWASGHSATLPVQALPGSAAPNGVIQLIGNVWEWTSSDFDMSDEKGRKIVGDMLMKSIRGGAYDTYFPWQAISTFRTGLGCMSRFQNVGFRCALDALPG